MIAAMLGPYRLDRELGAGGMGKVYAATVVGRCPGLAEGTVVALKVVHAHLIETPGFFKRFLREAEIGKSVVHENVVRTYDADAVAVSGVQHNLLVMEYVEGQTLRGLLKEFDRVPEELCRHIGREVAKGLSAIHAAGVIHRDMKPENVLITGEHVVKVMDLGVARLSDDALRLSQTGAFVGSIHYAAPECFSEGGKHVDGRADLHALGLVLYELACGVNPYYAETVPEILKKVLHEEPRRLGDVNPQLSAFFEEVVHCLLAKKPQERFATAAELLSVLEDGEKSAWWTSRAKAIRAETHRPLRRIRIPRETAVYGREADLAKLKALYEKAKSGEGQVVVIEGEAGIGKSRVVDELIGRLQRDGEDLNFLFGSYPPNGAATASGAFSAAYREHFGNGGSAAYLAHLQTLVPAFDALLGGTAAPTGVEPLTKDSLQSCFVTATRSLAAERPTVVLIDDLHFAPDEGRALFTALATAVPGTRILLIGTTRPGVAEEWTAGLTRLDQTSQVVLQRLGARDLVDLLRDSFRSNDLAQRLGLQIAMKSDGNPFFAFEIIRGLREGQFITQRDDGTWVSTGVIDEIRIPSSVLDLVNARVAGLTEDERALLDVAACWGYEFDPGLVGDVLGLARIPTLRAFGQIERRHRLVRASGRSMVFDHHQVQEALYGSLLEQLREEYHAALADTLAARTKAAGKDPDSLDGALCVDLCEHYLKGARGEDALRYLKAAQNHLRKGYLHAQVVSLTERALAVPGLLTGAERAEALLSLSGSLEHLSRQREQRRAIDEAVALADAAGGIDLRARAHRVLGHWLERAYEHDAAIRELEFALALAREAGSRETEGNATSCLSLVFMNSGRLAEAEANFRRLIGHWREMGNRLSEAIATAHLGRVLGATDRLAEAQEQFERDLALCREIGNREHEASSTGNLGTILLCRGKFAEAQGYFERSIEIAREIGSRLSEATGMGNLGGALQAQGRLAEAQDCVLREIAIAREMGDRRLEAVAVGSLGGIIHHQGRLTDAQEHLERCRRLNHDLGNRRGEAIALVNLGPIWHGLGDRVRARQAFDESVALCRAIGAQYPEGYGLIGLGRLADEEGDRAEAMRLTQESLALRRRIGHADGAADSLFEIGAQHARAGDAEAARAAFEEAVRIARELGRRTHVAWGLAQIAALPGGDASAALAAAEEAGESADALNLRWALYRATGDRAHLAAAKRLLDASLAKVPAEHHAAMLANVRLNREVAAAAQAAGL